MGTVSASCYSYLLFFMSLFFQIVPESASLCAQYFPNLLCACLSTISALFAVRHSLLLHDLGRLMIPLCSNVDAHWSLVGFQKDLP